MARTGIREAMAVNRVILGNRLSRFSRSGESTTDRFEHELADFMGSDHCVAVNSGTNALICALVGSGIGPGDEVLVPAYTWVSSAAAPIAVGAVPILVDVDETLTMDVEDIERKCSPWTRAIIPVHMNNRVCDMDSIMKIAADRDLVVIEDACQAIGVSFHDRPAGSIGHVGAFSFNHHKNISCGEGGALVTNDEQIATRARMYHDVGSFVRPGGLARDVPAFVGINARMPEISSAMLRPQLRRLATNTEKRIRRREVLQRGLEASTGFAGHLAPHHDPDAAAAIAVQFDDAEQAAEFSRNRGVTRLIDSGRHVFTNWEPILDKRVHHPGLDPYANHPRQVTYGVDDHPQTLDILERTCTISTPPNIPLAAFEVMARTYFRS
jgi:dTDP-4-amino-4,6-dideoxygalactose transaminase